MLRARGPPPAQALRPRQRCVRRDCAAATTCGPPRTSAAARWAALALPRAVLAPRRAALVPPGAVLAPRRAWAPPRAALAPLRAAPVPPPPGNYDYKAEILPDTRRVVSGHYPELQDLVDAGNLVVHVRPEGYSERRADGYREPRLVFILGTAHVSAAAALEVERLVAAVRPQCVVVELCKSRAGVLSAAGPGERPRGEEQSAAGGAARRQGSSDGGGADADADPAAAAAAAARRASNGEASGSGGGGGGGGGSGSGTQAKLANPLMLTGESFVAALARSARLGGQSGLLLRLLMAGQARRAADRLGVLPGAEFRSAARAADGVGASLVLGDRPIEITLERAWAALTWRRRLQLIGDLLTAGLSPQAESLSAEDVERLRSDDAISQLFKQLRSSYPELVQPLISERDLYLAWSLKRSKAVNGTDAVVGVVGKGHLRGIVYALRHPSGALRFSDLVGGKNRKRSRAEEAAAVARRLAAEAALGAGLYVAWVALSASGGSGP